MLATEIRKLQIQRQFILVFLGEKSHRCKAAIRFSNNFCRYKKELGLFGVKGNKATGADENDGKQKCCVDKKKQKRMTNLGIR